MDKNVRLTPRSLLVKVKSALHDVFSESEDAFTSSLSFSSFSSDSSAETVDGPPEARQLKIRCTSSEHRKNANAMLLEIVRVHTTILKTLAFR